MLRRVHKVPLGQIGRKFEDFYLDTVCSTYDMFALATATYCIDSGKSADDIVFEDDRVNANYKALLFGEDVKRGHIRKTLAEFDNFEIALFEHIYIRYDRVFNDSFTKGYKHFVSLGIDERFSLIVGINSFKDEHTVRSLDGNRHIQIHPFFKPTR